MLKEMLGLPNIYYRLRRFIYLQFCKKITTISPETVTIHIIETLPPSTNCKKPGESIAKYYMAV